MTTILFNEKYDEFTMLIERDKTPNHPRIEVEISLPFYGVDAKGNSFILIPEGRKPEAITIDFESDGSVNVYHWADPDDARADEYIPCTVQDWINAKAEAAIRCSNLPNGRDEQKMSAIGKSLFEAFRPPTPDWWNDLYTDAAGNCFSDAEI